MERKINSGFVIKSLAAALFLAMLSQSVFAASADADFIQDYATITSKSNPAAKASEEIAYSPNRVSIGLEPRRQTAQNGKADYKIIVSALYLPDTTNLQQNEYNLFFESGAKALHGELSQTKIFLKPGEKISVELKAWAEKPGDHQFIVYLIDKEGNKQSTTGYLFVPELSSPPSKKIKIEIQPEKQYTETGTASYTITLYRQIEQSCYKDSEYNELCGPQTYSLSFFSEHKTVKGMFVTNSISLLPGEKNSVKLEVSAEEKGTYIFRINAESETDQNEARGLLIYNGETQKYEVITTAPNSVFFDGEGFAANEEHAEGVLAFVQLLKTDNELRGKLNFNKNTYAVKGTVSDMRVSLEVFGLEDGGFSRTIGRLDGELRKFDSFTILNGQIEFTNALSNSLWTITLIEKQNQIFKSEIVFTEPEVPVTQTISKEEIVTVKTDDVEPAKKKEAYIIPGRIERKKIFGFIPNPWGEKILNLKFIDGNITIEKRIPEFGRTRIGEYEISVGSLENEKAIDVSIIKKSSIRLN